MGTDADAARRLATLRATDSIGAYSSDAPMTGADRTGRVLVTLDPTNRVTSVTLTGLPDELRTPTALARAVGEGYDAALRDKVLAADPERATTSRPLPEVRRLRRPPRPPRPVRPEDGGPDRPLPSPAVVEERRAQRGRVARSHADCTGVSDNDCVTVTVPPGIPRGEIDADPGWLRHAAAQQVAAALTQAYADSYRKRDRA